MWKKTGAERVKSFKLYQELESEYAKALGEIERLKTELSRKDGLIRHMAAELSGAPTSKAVVFTPAESTLPMPFSEVRTTRTVSPPTMPIEGNGEETTVEDELGHIRTTPKGTKAKPKG